MFVWIAPVVLAPIFNKFEPLPEASARAPTSWSSADEAGVDIGEVYRIDASRRVTSLNAFVDGIGSSKRVVLYDNLLDAGRAAASCARSSPTSSATSPTTTSGRGIAYVAIVAPFGLLFIRELALAIARRRGRRPGVAGGGADLHAGAHASPSIVLGVPGNQLSRKIEASADEFALELTDDPAGADRPAGRSSRGRISPIPTRRAGRARSSAPTRRPSSGSARRSGVRGAA